MGRIFAKRIMVGILSISLLGASLPSASYAGMMGTQTLIETQQTSDARARVNALGADPADVQERVAALTEAELRDLHQHIDTMPAGGILALVGVVFVVLIILELTGTIDIFKKA